MAFVFNTRISVSFALLTPYLRSELKLGRISSGSRRWLFANSSLRQGTQFTRPMSRIKFFDGALRMMPKNNVSLIPGWVYDRSCREHPGTNVEVYLPLPRICTHCKGLSLRHPKIFTRRIVTGTCQLSNASQAKETPSNGQWANQPQLMVPPRFRLSILSFQNSGRRLNLWQSLRGLGSLSKRRMSRRVHTQRRETMRTAWDHGELLYHDGYNYILCRTTSSL